MMMMMMMMILHSRRGQESFLNVMLQPVLFVVKHYLPINYWAMVVYLYTLLKSHDDCDDII